MQIMSEAQSVLIKKNGYVDRILDHQLKARMISLGIRRGRAISLIRTSLFGKCCYIRVGTQIIGMRAEEAAQILIV